MFKIPTKRIFNLTAPLTLGAFFIAAVFATTVFARPTIGPEINCQKIHWEIQNDSNSQKQFIGRITSPIDFTTNATINPGESGVLDKTFEGLNGDVTVTASLTMEGEVLNTTKTLNCTQSTPSPTPTPSPLTVQTEASQSQCVKTDIKGRLEYTGNHLAANPVIAHFDNVATDQNCAGEVFIHAFGSGQDPESLGWLESQKHVFSKTIKVPQGSKDLRFEIAVPNADFCWYQVEATRNPNVLIPPEYQGTDIIDYAFVKDTDSCLPPTATPTPSPCTTNCGGINITNNNNNTNNNTNNNNINITNTSTANVAQKLPETGAGTVAIAAIGGMAPLGFALSKFRKGRLYKEEQSLEEFATSIFKERTGNLS